MKTTYNCICYSGQGIAVLRYHAYKWIAILSLESQIPWESVPVNETKRVPIMNMVNVVVVRNIDGGLEISILAFIIGPA